MEIYEMSHILKCGQRYESGNYKYPGIETGGLFNLEPEYIVEKRKYKKLEIMQPRIKNKSELPVG